MILYSDSLSNVSLSGHPHLGVFLWSSRRSSASFMSVPSLKPIAQIVQQLLMGSQNLEIRSRDPGNVNLGVVL